MPTARIAGFDSNLLRSRELVGLGQSISGMTTGAVDASDMYRAALVQGVAALDSYVHGIVLDFAVLIVLGARPPGSTERIGLHFGHIWDLLDAPNATEREMRARAAINGRLSVETFQKPDDIARALTMVGVPKIWNSVFGKSASAKTKALNLVVQRRNGIVHRCDVDPAGSGGVIALSDADALAALVTVETVLRGIDAHL